MSTTAIELPLFPLNTVLFPGTVLPLHIFEPRYRQMIIDCLREKRPFGIVLLKPESEQLREIPYSVGTMAEIRNLDRLEDGRYNLVAVGTRRFRILSQHRERPYLTAMVEPYEDVDESIAELDAYVEQAHNLFGAYLQMLLEAANEPGIEAALPDEAEDLSHFIAYFLDIQDEQKQYFLELTSTRQRLSEEVAILRREVPFMRMILSNKLPGTRAMLN